MSTHDTLKTELKEGIQRYAISRETNWQIKTEHYVNPATVVSSRRADVAVLTDDLTQNGYAFEIKRGDWSVKILVHQLRDYLLAGYIPIVVCPQDVTKKTFNTNGQCSVGWILEFLSASVVLPLRPDEGRFELQKDRLSVDDPLRGFFE